MTQISSTREKNSELSAVHAVFARHETFHPRFGWLKKGFDRAKVDPGIFLQKDAPVELGVGKNMVRSIRYWCNAFKVLGIEDGSRDTPTEFGQKLLDDRGWDPFLEDPASLWLLHWHLLEPTCDAAAWYYTFNIFRQVDFSTEDLFAGLRDYSQSLATRNIADSSLRKDISCILRMYGEPEASRGFVEDSIDCPFTELGLIRTAGDSGRYTFRIGSKANLPPQIVVAACLEYAARVTQGAKTIAISRLLYDIGSPGMAFKLSESALCEAIEQVASTQDRVALSDAAGLIQFSFTEEPEALANDILDKYYTNP
ncbi:MAG: DUF4007 family protein [Cyanobacteriota bacterium]|nr:DUF4007 family protein [Cyanobacteriota bacterium]